MAEEKKVANKGEGEEVAVKKEEVFEMKVNAIVLYPCSRPL